MKTILTGLCLFVSLAVFASGTYKGTFQGNGVGITNVYLGTTPTITINAPTLVTSANFIGTPKDCAFILTFQLSAATQAGGSNYITINLTSPALSTNPVVALFGEYGGNTLGSPTNTTSGIPGTLNKFQLMTTSNSIILNSYAPPTGSSTNTIAILVERF